MVIAALIAKRIEQGSWSLEVQRKVLHVNVVWSQSNRHSWVEQSLSFEKVPCQNLTTHLVGIHTGVQ